MGQETSVTVVERSRLDPGFRAAWTDATASLFGGATCTTLKKARRLAELVRSALRVEAAAPGRLGLRNDLNEIIRATDMLTKLLTEQAISDMAPEVANALSDSHVDTATVLSRVTRLAERRLSLLGIGAGQGKAPAAFGSPSPEIQCAAAVAEAWERSGRSADNRNEGAQEACAALWRLAGGETSTRECGGGLDGRWDRHLRTVARHATDGEPRRRPRGEQVRVGSPAVRLSATRVARDRARAVLDGHVHSRPEES
jgi:hypothetical protein